MAYRIIHNGQEYEDGFLPENCAMDIWRTNDPPDEFDTYASLADAKRAAVNELNDYIKSIPRALRYTRNQIRALTPATVTERDDYDEEEDLW